MRGWIKLYREMIDWRWYKNKNVKILFIHLILRANHEDGSFENIKLTKGQLITGRKQLSEETGLSEREVRTALKKLVDTQEIIKESTSRFSIITICKWDNYQSMNSISDQPKTNDRPAIDQPLTTNKNAKNMKNGKKINIDFDTFWNLYGKEVDRKKCETLWVRLTDAERTACIEKIPEYISVNPDKKFRRDPEKYLTNKCWGNEIIQPNSKAQAEAPQFKPIYNSGPGR